MYRLYTFDGQLKSFEDNNHNICGWYDDENLAFRDYERAKSMYSKQIVLIEYDKQPKIIAIS